MGRVTVELTGDEHRLLRSLDKVIEKEKKLGGAAADAGRKSKKAADQAKKGAKGWSADLAAAATGYLSIAAAASAAKKMLAELNQERKRGAQGVMAGEGSMRRLMQLVSTPEERKQVFGAVAATRKQAGVDKATAGNLQFALRSVGLEKDRKLFASLYDLTGMGEGPESLARGIAKIQGNFGVGETGGARQLLNKMFRATKDSDIGAEEIAFPAAQVAQNVKKLGGGDEEFLAAIATMSRVAKDPSLAATQLGAFADAIRKRGFKGTGIMEGYKYAQEQTAGMSQEKVIEWFGRKEGERGFGLLGTHGAEIRRLASELHAVDAATGEGDYLDRRLAMAGGDKQLAAAKARRVASQKRKLTEEGYLGVDQLGRESKVDELVRRDIEAGVNPVMRTTKRWGAELGEYLGMGAGGIETMSDVGAFASGPGVLWEAGRELLDAAGALSDSAVKDR